MSIIKECDTPSALCPHPTCTVTHDTRQVLSTLGRVWRVTHHGQRTFFTHEGDADKFITAVLAVHDAATPEPTEYPLFKSDGSTAKYYELPEGATELQHLISAKNMNGQIATIFSACYRYGEVAHSAKLRDAKKMVFYAQAEVDRLEKYGE